MASAFRRAAELGGLLESVEADKPVIILVTQAATGGRPLAVVNHLYEAIDLGKLDPELKNVTNPFTGREVFAIQFLKADIFIMQAQVSDEYGNGQYWGGTGHEREKAKAATIVIVQSPFLRPSLDRSVRQGRWRRAAAVGSAVHGVVWKWSISAWGHRAGYCSGDELFMGLGIEAPSAGSKSMDHRLRCDNHPSNTIRVIWEKTKRTRAPLSTHGWPRRLNGRCDEGFDHPQCLHSCHGARSAPKSRPPRSPRWLPNSFCTKNSLGSAEVGLPSARFSQ